MEGGGGGLSYFVFCIKRHNLILNLAGKVCTLFSRRSCCQTNIVRLVGQLTKGENSALTKNVCFLWPIFPPTLSTVHFKPRIAALNAAWVGYSCLISSLPSNLTPVELLNSFLAPTDPDSSDTVIRKLHLEPQVARDNLHVQRVQPFFEELPLDVKI